MALNSLGLNPTDQEVVDIPVKIARKGLIYFPDFCQLVLKRFRNSEEQEENFKQNMFKVWTKSVHLDIYIKSIVLSFIWKNMIIVFGQESFQLGLIYMSF